MQSRKAVFLDRDGVLSRSDVRDGKPFAPTRFEDFALLPDAPAFIRDVKENGFLTVVVTNQPDVGNGLTERAEVERMNAELARQLGVDLIKTCFHSQSAGCACRKPKPGMLLDAAEELDISLAESFMIGDRWSDIDAGRSAGCLTVFIDCGYSEKRPDAPDYTVADLTEAADLIRTGGGPGHRI